jgi:glutamate synthase domain-containing protein 1
MHHNTLSLLTAAFIRSVGMVFMPNDDALEAQAKAITEEVVAAEGLTLLGWRQVPVAPEVVGRFAKATQPRIWQVGRSVCYMEPEQQQQQLSGVSSEAAWAVEGCVPAASQHTARKSCWCLLPDALASEQLYARHTRLHPGISC